MDHLRDVITSQIPMSHMVSNEAEEVTFALPSNQVSEFERLFEKLETDGKTLGIDSLGVYFTSMEEIFLRSAFPQCLRRICSYLTQIFIRITLLGIT